MFLTGEPRKSRVLDHYISIASQVAPYLGVLSLSVYFVAYFSIRLFPLTPITTALDILIICEKVKMKLKLDKLKMVLFNFW